MNVTVAVCSRDRPADLAGCLTSLAGSLREGDELLVVDSASRTDDTAAVARGAGAALVRVDRPGLSRARNAALAHAGHEVVAFTDDDCRPDAGWVAAIAAAFAAEPDAGTDLAPATTGDADRGLGFLTGRVTAHGGGAPVVLLLDDSPHRIDATTPLEEAKLIPNGAFYNETGGNWVFVVAPDGKSAVKRQVRLGRRNSETIEVLEGLDVGERVITSPYTGFADKERLELDD